MSRRIAALVMMGISFGVGSAYAQESNAAPAFFGRDARYAHRVYGGVIINTR